VALAPWLDASSAGSSDLIVAGRKFSGNAQQRKRRHLLHHGTLLCRGCDIAAMSRFLKPPPRQPAYRDERSHDDFLTLLPATPDEVADRLADVWDASTRIDSWPREQVNQLVSEKFGQDEWTFRR
jgi:lipoate-protein ligase A